jgi:hypothetical protein
MLAKTGPLVGLGLNRAAALLKQRAQQFTEETTQQLKHSVAEVGVTIALLLVAAITASMTFAVGLAALFLWVDRQQGPMIALAVVAGVTAIMTAILLSVALLRGRSKKSTAVARRAKPLAAPSATALPPLPPNASTADVIAHRFKSQALAASEDVVGAAADAIRTIPRPTLLAMLAIAVLAGVVIGRRR